MNQKKLNKFVFQLAFAKCIKNNGQNDTTAFQLSNHKK